MRKEYRKKTRRSQFNRVNRQHCKRHSTVCRIRRVVARCAGAGERKKIVSNFLENCQTKFSLAGSNLLICLIHLFSAYHHHHHQRRLLAPVIWMGRHFIKCEIYFEMNILEFQLLCSLSLLFLWHAFAVLEDNYGRSRHNPIYKR